MLRVNGNRNIQKFVGKGSTEERAGLRLDIPVIYKIKGAKNLVFGKTRPPHS